MDSAPKTGERILAAIQGVDRAVLCLWNGAEWATFDGHDWSGRRLTHWQPIPSPPTSGEGA